MISLWIRDVFAGRRVEQATNTYLEHLRQAPVLQSQSAASRILARLRNEPGPHVRLGETVWGEPVIVPLTELIKVGLTTGGMGSGKTMFALLPIAAVIRLLPTLGSVSFGVIDPKGELFERCLYLLAARLAELDGAAREALLRRMVVIDFSSREAISPYNILVRSPYADLDFFITSRLETLRELLPAREKLSLRGAEVLRNIIILLSEFGLPLTYLEPVLSNEALRHRLILKSGNAAVRHYFQRHFATEGKQTIAALRTRMEALFVSHGVRLALSGSSAPDFRRLQDEGKIVLIRAGGPGITRGVRLLLQGLVLSDIRQAVFARPNNPPVTYWWCADESQNFFMTRQQQEDMFDVLTMGRSFGSFFCFLCQNLSASIPNARLLQQVFTNMYWSMTLRGTPQDALFLRSALPVTGRRQRPDPHPFRERTFYSLQEERTLLLDGIAHLPNQEGYLWLKTRSAEAIRLRTQLLELPDGELFRQAVAELSDEPALGGRLSREKYESQIQERDRQWFGPPENAQPPQDRWEEAYRRQEMLWRI